MKYIFPARHALCSTRAPQPADARLRALMNLSNICARFCLLWQNLATQEIFSPQLQDGCAASVRNKAPKFIQIVQAISPTNILLEY